MNTTIPAIKQSEAAKLLGIAPADVREFREKHLKPDEWWKEGVPVVWSREAFDRIQQASALVQVPVASGFGPEVQPDTLTVRAIKASRNTRFLYADLHGERISVKCHPRKRDALIGKTIRVRVETTEGQTTYTHEP
jgi:hypothetical protein